MNIYTMSQIETLTGINAHSLRVWERRYSFIKPMRTDTNIRYYTEQHLKLLLNISVLSRNGYKISKINNMPLHEINNKVEDILTDNTENKSDYISALVICMLELNENSFNKIFQKQILSHGLLDTITNLIYPFLNLVGALWTGNKAIPAQEHFISNLIRQKIIYNIELLPKSKNPKGNIVMFLTKNEHHEIGLLVAYFIAKQMNWNVYYLGLNVPTEDITSLESIIKPDLMFTMFTVPKQKSVEEILSQDLGNINCPIIVSGAPHFFTKDIENKNIIFLKSPNEFIEYLDKINCT